MGTITLGLAEGEAVGGAGAEDEWVLEALSCVWNESRSVGSVVSTALRCYVSRAAFFMTITAIVVVPWALVIWLVTGRGLLDQRNGGSGDALLSLGISTLIVGPLVSALHVHALTDLGSGQRPQPVSVLRRGVLALPVVAAAQVAADLAPSSVLSA